MKFAALPWNEDEFINTWFDFTELAKPDEISGRASDAFVKNQSRVHPPGPVVRIDS